MIDIPADLAKGHGGDQAASIGARWAETFQSIGGLRGADRVLDIGCGPGRMAVAIGERFGWTPSYTGFEIQERDVVFCTAQITSQHPNFRFVHLNVYNGLYNPGGKILPHEAVFPVEAGSIDFAFATSVFTHMFRREVEHYAAQAFAALRPGGTFLSSWFLMPDPDKQAAAPRKLRFDFATMQHDGTATVEPETPEEGIAFTLDAACEILRDAGFRSVALHRGAWSDKKRDARHSQDILVARRG